MAKQKSIDDHNEHLVMLEERKVKALEKIANTIDALTLWFEDIDKTEWSDRLQWYLAELHAKFLKEEGRTNLYITIIESNPLLIDDSLIQINIMNNAQEKIINDNKAFLLSFLRKELNNYLIDIKIMIGKDIEKEKKLYTSIDIFKDMIKNNRSLKVLQEKLGLDPDY